MKYPNKIECMNLLKKYPLPKGVMNHSLIVKTNALAISNQLLKKGIKIDVELIESASLLHDIGRWKYSKEKNCSESEGTLHIYETYRLLYQLGYRKFAKICASHALGGLDRGECKQLFSENIELIPKSTEAKIINISDKIEQDRNNLDEIIVYYTSHEKYNQRFYNKSQKSKKLFVTRFTKSWNEIMQVK